MKLIMKFACIFNCWLKDKYGVIGAEDGYFGKEVHLTKEAFIKMFVTYDCVERYTDSCDKLFVHENGVTYFALVEREV